MRIPVVMIALALAGGCASTSGSPPATSTAAAPRTAPAATAASNPNAAKTVTSSTARKSPLGYRVAKKNGQTYYCRDEKPVGSNIPHTVCLTPDEYAQVQEQAETQRQDVRRHTNICASPSGACGTPGG